MKLIYLFLLSLTSLLPVNLWAQSMMFGDTVRTGMPFSKDPHVISFRGKYLMYYSIHPRGDTGWGIGIAESKNLQKWERIGEVPPTADYEAKGLCAPCALSAEWRSWHMELL